MGILLKNATFIDYRTSNFVETDVFVEEGVGGKITLLSGKKDFVLPEGTKVVDCRGMYVTKALACGHHHVYSALSRGMPASPKPMNNFYQVLEYLWWTLDKCLDRDMIEASALVTALSCAYNGVTFVIDHHASPFAVEGSLQTIATAFEKVGVSHLLCYEVTDRDGHDIALKGLAETGDFMQKNQGLVGLHAAFTVEDETLKLAVDLAAKLNSGIHVHVAEDKYDQDYSIEKYGKRVVNRLHEAGALSFPKTILGHCIHLDTAERELIQKSPVYVVQNIESNLNNKVGQFNSEGLGKNLMLGTDGMHSDMVRSAQNTFFAGKNYDSFGFDEPYRRLRNVHNYVESNGFTGDGDNNLIVLDYPSPSPFNGDNFLGHFYFGMESKYVKHVISDGKMIVADKKIQTVNEAEILAFAKEQAQRLWDRINDRYSKF
ncbi:MAG: amidohydrolase family protein [Bacteroidota bacterium]